MLHGGHGGAAPAAGTAASAETSSGLEQWMHSIEDALPLELKDLGKFGEPLFWAYLMIPPLLFGLLIPGLGKLNKLLSTRLNDMENHRTESTYRNHLVAKVFLFRLVSCFVLLYYYAFSGKHPLTKLMAQLASFMASGVTLKLVGSKWLLPKMKRAWAARRERATRRAKARRGGDGEPQQRQQQGQQGQQGQPQGGGDLAGAPSTAQPSAESRHAERAWSEYKLQEYDTFDDFAEMLVQFGYVTLFSLAFPLAPAFALLNNVVEVQLDASKLCRDMRRPVARKASNIGVWLHLLQGLSITAAVTNCAHIGFTSVRWRSQEKKKLEFARACVSAARRPGECRVVCLCASLVAVRA